MMSAPAREPGVATTIDEVIEQLNDIIAWSIREESRLGFFAALYRKVTVKVKEGIAEGRFENGPRMERLDVTFANRYLKAMDQFRQGQRPTLCWLASFKAATSYRPIILQQLLLGMNAHINFDLGLAAAEVSPGGELASLEPDFNEINNILAGLVGQVQSEIDEVSPWIRFLDHIDPKADVAVVNFSMEKARGCSWDLAKKLAPLSPNQWKLHLDLRDVEATALAELVRHPIGLFLNLGLLAVRSRENHNVAKVIEVLNQTSTEGV
ncbi:MAG: DUF5995 family protein [Blastocatellia bacterium]